MGVTMSHRNRDHPAHLHETVRIDIETIESGDECAYVVLLRGHGGLQRQVVADVAGVKAAIADGLEDWQTYCQERRTAQHIEATEIHGPVDL